MKAFLFISLAFFIVSADLYAQSGRPAAAPTVSDTRTAKELFDEANSYRKIKYDEFEKKKVPVSERLRLQTESEQKQLAARNAAILNARKDLSSDDIYYLALLNWISENLDATAETLERYLKSDGRTAEWTQTARSLMVVVLAKKKLPDDALAYFAEYEAGKPSKTSETLRMNTELAKAFLAIGQPEKAVRFADTAFSISKVLSVDGTSTTAMDLVFDNGLVLFDAYRLSGNTERADAALADIRQVSGAAGNSTYYYYAADRLITYQIGSGRKQKALDTYLDMLIAAAKELGAAGQRTEVIGKLKRREKQYKLLGEPAPELVAIDKWIPAGENSILGSKGKVILLDFWATWCAPCYEAFPHLAEWSRDLGDKGLVIIGVTRYYGRTAAFADNEKAEFDMLVDFRAKHKLPYSFAVGKDQSTHLLYGASSLPTAVLIDRKGIVRYIEPGTSSSRITDMREMVLKLLAEE